MTFSLEDKRCVVTGGGTGIGRGIAQELTRAGAHVAICGRREAMLDQTLASLTDLGKHGSGAIKETMDATDHTSVASAIDRMAEQLGGGIDILVNNAGVGGPNACAEDGPDTWDLILRTNLDGVYFCSREALRHMPDGGRVINISSVLGRFGVPRYTAYCTSKHGVIGFTKALALEVAHRDITVNAICPGWVDTDMAHDGIRAMAKDMKVSFDDAMSVAMDMVPLGRILQPTEVGGMVVYLASDAASGLTAQALSLCGGQVQN